MSEARPEWNGYCLTFEEMAERIRVAVAEEREACARVAESDALWTVWPLTVTEMEREKAVKRMIAAAILARGTSGRKARGEPSVCGTEEASSSLARPSSPQEPQ